jgi:hypothetical protein
MVMD